MYVKVDRNDLIGGISTAMRAVGSGKITPISACLLFEVAADGVKLTSNNLEMSIETATITATPTMEQEPGKVAIDARMFSDIVRNMPDGDIEICADDKNLVLIKSGKSEFKVLGMNAEEFPAIQEITPTGSFMINCSSLRGMIKQTIFCVSGDTSKPVFTGALMRVSSNKPTEGASEAGEVVAGQADEHNGIVEMCTLDGFRVSHIQFPTNYEDDDFSIVIPSRTLANIEKLLPNTKDARATIYFDNRKVWFFIDGHRIMSSLIDGDFFNYTTAFSREASSKAVVSRSELLGALERSTLIGERKDPVTLSITSDEMAISSRTEVGTMFEEIVVDGEGDNLTISFNPRYLVDFLKVTTTEYVEMDFAGNLSPCIIRPFGEDENQGKKKAPKVVKKDNTDDSSNEAENAKQDEVARGESKYLVLPLRLSGGAAVTKSNSKADTSAKSASKASTGDDSEQRAA